MKKGILPLIAGLCFFCQSQAQDAEGMKKHYLKMYQQAVNYNDPATAISALQGYLAIDNNVVYKDTLSILYFTAKNYLSSLIVAEEVMKQSPDNAMAKARAGLCYDELGDPANATKLFEEVVPKTKSPYLAYKLAMCQYQLKRVGEAEVSAKAVMADTSSKRIGTNFQLMNGQVQTVPIDAAAANLIGVIKMNEKNFADARQYFNQAITLFPDFVGAKENIAVCDKNQKPGTKPVTKPVTKPKG